MPETKRETCKWATNSRQTALADCSVSTCTFPIPAWMTREGPQWPTVWNNDCDRCPCHEPKEDRDDVS